MVPWTNQPNIGSLVQTTAWKNKTNVVKKHKRIRTAFTSNQMMELEQEYAKARYLDRNRRIELADKIRLNERTIKIWFQNLRMKEKKDRAESIEELDEVTLTGSPELVIPMPVQEQFPSNEMFHPQGVFIEHYPVSTTSMPVPQVAAPGNYLPYDMSKDHPYNQSHLQEQHQSSSLMRSSGVALANDLDYMDDLLTWPNMVAWTNQPNIGSLVQTTAWKNKTNVVKNINASGQPSQAIK
ncbi:Hox cluster protein ShxA [Operophtera brumata]|uniref:Hox cluster protein ShxA n=1 Tax=Operophtera brumata TaxID=104452 RepID=A0A0L7LFD2_OPEBR|nr:Hox cluster protein ShxA [Operophtera brumata]